jgi:hypothetical protein
MGIGFRACIYIYVHLYINTYIHNGVVRNKSDSCQSDWSLDVVGIVGKMFLSCFLDRMQHSIVKKTDTDQIYICLYLFAPAV